MEVSRELPKRLLDFFTRYPPKLYSSKFTGISIPLTRREAQLAQEAARQTETAQLTTLEEMPRQAATNTSSEDPNASNIENSISLPEPMSIPQPTSRKDRSPPNPFMPFRNPETGRWRGAVIGLRRQADLVKLAKKYGIEELLPPGRKSTVFKEHRILTRGLRVRGTGVGQKVKGHKWERQQEAKLEQRRKAMQEMPDLVRSWKQAGHGRGWKKYPK